MKNKTNEQLAMHVSVVAIIWNIALSAFKLAVGIFANSSAMVSDAVHSASDVVSTFVVMIGIKMAAKEEDKEHPYGHERFECVAAIVLSAILFVTGLGIGYKGIVNIISGNFDQLATPGLLALIAAIASIIVKECMYWYTRSTAKKIDSGALMADAWHHRSDALSSIGSFVGILGARMGFPVLDLVAAIIICVFILKAAIDIFLDAIGKMMDKSCDDKTEEHIREIVMAQEGVLGVDVLKTRLFGDKIYVDVEISANGDATLKEAHAIAQRVHDTIEEVIPKVKHCMVHVNPAKVGSK